MLKKKNRKCIPANYVKNIYIIKYFQITSDYNLHKFNKMLFLSLKMLTTNRKNIFL